MVRVNHVERINNDCKYRCVICTGCLRLFTVRNRLFKLFFHIPELFRDDVVCTD